MPEHLADIDRAGRIDASGRVVVWTRCGLEVPPRSLLADSPRQCQSCHALDEGVRLVLPPHLATRQ